LRQSSLGGVGLAWEIDEVSDQNCDGFSDFVWRNTNSGAVLQWFIDGSTIPATLLSTNDLGLVGIFNEIQPKAPDQ